MFVSTTIAIVIDNVDPSKMHRIKVKFTTDTLGGRNSHSSWCRLLTPMAGMNRGLTMLPDVGTTEAKAVTAFEGSQASGCGEDAGA